MSDQSPLTYADAGVSLEAANDVVDQLKPAIAATMRPEVIGTIGGFGGLFSLVESKIANPVLVSSTDGVGTKIELARQLDRLDTIGQDLVAMVVDDLVVTGAEPLFFNDYLSIGKLDPTRVATIVGGIAEGCRLAGCALVGGETAEHRGVLDDDEFDLAGFGVGIVDRDEILGPDRVQAGDVLIAMASSGPHSNGYTLIRKIVHEVDLSIDHAGTGRPLSDDLLEPTRIHALDCLDLVHDDDVEVHAFCHVTGGGLVENLPRSLPDGLAAQIDTESWDIPAIFTWLEQAGPVARDEAWRVFNMGVGMVAIVSPETADAALAHLTQRDVDAWRLGTVIPASAGDSRVLGLI